MRREAIFVTGGTGLIGRRTLSRLLAREPELHAFVLVRDRARWNETAAAELGCDDRLIPVVGDVTRPGLGLSSAERKVMARRVGCVVHCAADTVFSSSLEDARRTNALGTANVVETVAGWPGLTRLVYVSTAFVAGRRTGRIFERWCAPSHGFVNSYEQSKHEAEAALRASEVPWTVVRPSTVACDSREGVVSQVNAVHRALRLSHGGLAPMLPGSESTPVDLVTTEYVADCIGTLLRAPDVEGRTFHVCAGDGAIALGALLDVAYDVWGECARWRRRSIARPALTDLETYRLFERTVEETADARLRSITRSLACFVPQLSSPKVFDTRGTEDVMGIRPPEVASFWEQTVRYLTRTRWMGVGGAR